MNTTTFTRVSFLATVLCVAQWLPLAADAQPAGEKRASVMLGAFITDRQSTTRLDSDFGDGTDIDMEDDLGLESSTNVARLGGYVWLGERHRLDGAYFDMSRSASLPINETIEFGDQTFAINTTVETESDLTIIKADYTFAIVSRERGWFGVTGGLYVAETALSLSQAALGRAETQDVTAPLPVFGVRGDYAINDRITLRGAVQLFAFEAEDVDGRFSDFYLGADYGFGERMAVGLAYNRVSMNLGAVEDRGLDARLDWGYDGLLLYFKFDLGSGN